VDPNVRLWLDSDDDGLVIIGLARCQGPCGDGTLG
jgi:hypothetical protein